MKVPTDVQISIALSYLRNNREEEGGEREACAAVAAWIEHEMLDRFVKAQARASGISVKRLRDAIKKAVTDRVKQETVIYALDRS